MCVCVPKLLGARVCILKSVSILENNPQKVTKYFRVKLHRKGTLSELKEPHD